eukprot:3388510-Pleurochrysis_carterae.AAC.4
MEALQSFQNRQLPQAWEFCLFASTDGEALTRNTPDSLLETLLRVKSVVLVLLSPPCTDVTTSSSVSRVAGDWLAFQ